MIKKTRKNLYCKSIIPYFQKLEKLWIKIRDLIKSITKNSDVCDEKYVKIKFNSDDELPVNKTIEIPIMVIVV